MTQDRKNKLCIQWIRYCQSIGWSTRELPRLADIFWQHDGWRIFKGYQPCKGGCDAL